MKQHFEPPPQISDRIHDYMMSLDRIVTEPRVFCRFNGGYNIDVNKHCFFNY